MLLGPPALWMVAAGGAPWERAGWSYGGVTLFALGWAGLGAGLRPSGSAARGLLFAVALYVLVGLVWVVAFNVGFLATPVTGILRDPLSVLLIAAMWPLNVAQAFGLFGHSFN